MGKGFVNDDGRGGMDEKEAAAAIAGMLGGRPDEIAAHPGGGWSFNVAEATAMASDVMKDHDHFDYCFIETSNESEEGWYRETIKQSIEPRGGRPGMIIEGLYSRLLGDNAITKSTLEGRYMVVPAVDWDMRDEEMSHSFGERTLDEQLLLMGYVRDGIRSASHHVNREVCGNLMRKAVVLMNEMNMLIMQLERPRAA